MGGRRKARGRDISGVLLLDKPYGISSNKALQRCRAIYNAKKAGHTGSLDPLASGLLPICFGEATKFSSYLLNSDKTYETEIKLGVKTSTGDLEGEVLSESSVPPLSIEEVNNVLQSFTGDIEQLPPMHSAVKINGQPLYKLARKGMEVERKPRTVTIYNITLLEFKNDCIRVSVSCSKGTYIRTLGEDIGEKIGCGAHISALRRTRVGEFDTRDMTNFEEIQAMRDNEAFQELDELLLPVESLLSSWPLLTLSPDASYYLKQGQPVLTPGAPTNGEVVLKDTNGNFLGLGEILDDGRVAPRRLINTA